MRRSEDHYLHSFDFAITTHCQAACRSCPRTDPDSGTTASWLKVEHMPYEVFSNIIDSSQIINESAFHAIFCGEYGDPMMHPEITKFIDKAFEQFHTIEINTNGGLRKPEWYEMIAKKYKDNLQINFGIDGTDHETNWKYRTGVDWERAMNNMLAFHKHGGIATWHFLVFEWNWHQLPEVERISKDNGLGVMYKINNRRWGKVSPEGYKYAKDFMDKL